jgi:hypothetical protein
MCAWAILAGHLHIGHAKAICLNLGLAAEFPQVTCYLRFDDTNPSTARAAPLLYFQIHRLALSLRAALLVLRRATGTRARLLRISAGLVTNGTVRGCHSTLARRWHGQHCPLHSLGVPTRARYHRHAVSATGTNGRLYVVS